MANRTGIKIPQHLCKNFYSQKQKNPQKEFYTKHLAPFYRKGLEPPADLLDEFYDIALNLLLQSLELDIERMVHLVYSEIERRPHKRDILLKYAHEEKAKIQQQMVDAIKLYASKPQIILLHKNSLRNVKSTCTHIFI